MHISCIGLAKNILKLCKEGKKNMEYKQKMAVIAVLVTLIISGSMVLTIIRIAAVLPKLQSSTGAPLEARYRKFREN